MAEVPISPLVILRAKEKAMDEVFDILIDTVNSILATNYNIARLTHGDYVSIYDTSQSAWVVYHEEVVEQFRAAGWRVEFLHNDMHNGPTYHFYLPKELLNVD